MIKKQIYGFTLYKACNRGFEIAWRYKYISTYIFLHKVIK